MKDRTTLTKSLHTITVVSRVALVMFPNETETEACRSALRVLGWNDESNWTRSDATFAACVAKLKQLRGAK